MCCDICGDIGVAATLITCGSCKRNTEHMYDLSLGCSLNLWLLLFINILMLCPIFLKVKWKEKLKSNKFSVYEFLFCENSSSISSFRLSGLFYPDIRYWMKVVLEEHVGNWICIECSEASSSQVRKSGKLGAQSRKSSNESRKTKCISAEEVIALLKTSGHKRGRVNKQSAIKQIC